MSFTVTQMDILSVRADAAVLPLEMSGGVAQGTVGERLLQAGGAALEESLRQKKFVSVGKAAAAEAGGLPFRHLILTASPRWLTGKANELLMLQRCYESVFDLAESLDCQSVALPFLSCLYYRFPREDAVHIARREAEKRRLEAVFVAETSELYRLSGQTYRKPQIVSYIGYYRDHAIFALDNGLFARVDLRPEMAEVSVIPYFEACYRVGNNPLQPPLPEREIDRLRRVYEMAEL